MCGAVVALVSCCAVCFPYLSSFVDCCFVHGAALIIYWFDGGVDDCYVIILSLDYAFVYLVVHLFLAPYVCFVYEVAVCVCGLVSLTWIGRELC